MSEREQVAFDSDANRACPVCNKPVGLGVQHEHFEITMVNGAPVFETVWSSFWPRASGVTDSLGYEEADRG